MEQQDPKAVARSIIDANLYMTLATVDDGGQPWVSPVFYASRGASEFYWVSALDAAHSRNLASRPRLSIVLFDSRVPASTPGSPSARPCSGSRSSRSR